MSPQSIERKEKRRKDIERKKNDKFKRRNPIAQDLNNPKYFTKVVETKERGGAKNLLKEIEKDIIDD